MFKINCHAHSVNSDGGDTLLDMANEAKRLGMSALVITDHDSVNHSSYHLGVREMQLLEELDKSPLPIIIGSEIMTPFGEFLLFGKDVLKQWTRFKERLDYIANNFDHTLWVELFYKYVLCKNTYNSWGGQMVRKADPTTEYPYAMIVCHPRFSTVQRIGFYPTELWGMCHGFEIQNGQEEFDRDNPHVVARLRELIPGGIELRNSDAHSADSLPTVWNETKTEITTEPALIKWLRSGKRNKRIKEMQNV